MSVADVLALEGMGFRFRMDGDRVTRRCYGTPPPEAAELLARVTRADVVRVLEDRAAGFTPAPGIDWPVEGQKMAAGPAADHGRTANPPPPRSASTRPQDASVDLREGLVARFRAKVEAAARAGQDGVTARPLWDLIVAACEEVYNAGAHEAALDALAAMERLHRDAMRRKTA